MVTRKITLSAIGWGRGDKNKIKLGNKQAHRDWGYAGDYVRPMHAMLQQEKPADYVIATGSRTVFTTSSSRSCAVSICCPLRAATSPR